MGARTTCALASLKFEVCEEVEPRQRGKMLESASLELVADALGGGLFEKVRNCPQFAHHSARIGLRALNQKRATRARRRPACRGHCSGRAADETTIQAISRSDLITRDKNTSNFWVCPRPLTFIL